MRMVNILGAFVWPAALSTLLLAQSASSVDGRGMYVPPAQHPVRVTIADGALLVDGLVSSSNESGDTSRLFVLDSAATTTDVDPSIARGLGGKGIAGEQIKDATLRMAGAQISHMPVRVVPLDAWFRQTGLGVAGIAGSDIFAHFDVRIDYVHRLLTLAVPQSCAVPWQRIPLHVMGGLPFVDADLETASGKKLRGLFLVDTGQSGYGLVLTNEFLSAHPELAGKQARVEAPLLDATGGVKKTRLLRVTTLKIGNNPLHGVVATVAPPAAGGAGARLAGVIGGGVLSRFDVVMDLPHATLTLTPNADYSAPFEADMSGMLVVAAHAAGDASERSGERKYVVAGISEKSPAADAGVQAGDQLLEIAGEKVAEMTLDQVRSLFKSEPGTRVLVTIDRSQKKVMVTLTLRRAI